MAIYSIYISKVNNLNDFILGTPILNRTNVAQKNTMGMFINTIPIRIKIEDNSNIIDFLNDYIWDLPQYIFTLIELNTYCGIFL